MDANTTDSISQPLPEKIAADLRACLEAPYEVRLREKAGRFTLYIPELGLVAHGKSLEAAHAELMQARERRIQEFASEDLLSWLPRPGAPGGPGEAEDKAEPRLLLRLRPFLIKAAIASLLFLWAVNLVSDSLRNVGYGLEKKLDGVVNWSPETVEGHRARAAQIAAKLGPIVREMTAMFRDPATPVDRLAPSAAANATGGAALDAAAPAQGGQP